MNPWGTQNTTEKIYVFQRAITNLNVLLSIRRTLKGLVVPFLHDTRDDYELLLCGR